MSQVAAGPNGSTSTGRSSRTRVMIASVLAGVAVVFALAGFFIAHGLSSSSTPTTTIPPRTGVGTRPAAGALAGLAASGTVKSVNRNADQFTVSTLSGATVTVSVTSSTTYASRGAASSSFAQVVVGARVGVKGTTSNGVVHATSVEILPAGGFRGGFGGAGTPGAFGTVATVDASTHSFTVTSRGGTAVTVDVSSSTTYTSYSGGTASFSSITVGSRVAATGTTASDGTVDATRIVILPAGGTGGGFGGGFGGGGGAPSSSGATS